MVWRVIPFTYSCASENMAMDEAIFRVHQQKDSPPTLRIYRWCPPAISLGYFQKTWNEVDVAACSRYHIDIVRRPTGGKAVLHDNDLTYAVIAKEHHPPFTPDILSTYRIISGCIADALSELGIHAEMSVDGRTTGDGSLKAVCFSSPSHYELLANTRKICGSAQVRSRGVFLQHGSILLDFDPVMTCELLAPRGGDRARQIEKLRESVTSVYEQTGAEISIEKMRHVLQRSFEKKLGIELVEGCLTGEEKALMARLIKEKYANNKWNMEGRGASHGY